MKRIVKNLTAIALLLGSGAVLAASSSAESIGGVADTILTSLGSVEQMIIVLCYISGLGFAGAGILKFKQHKDNPSQVPLGAPIAMVFIAAALIYLPQVIRTTGTTLFGSTENSAGQFLEGTGITE